VESTGFSLSESDKESRPDLFLIFKGKYTYMDKVRFAWTEIR